MLKRVSVMFLLTVSLLTFRPAIAADTRANNEARVKVFYDSLNRDDFGAASQVVDPRYRHHNPAGSGGVDELKAFFDFLKTKHPHAHFAIKRIISENNYIVVHLHAVLDPGSKGSAIVDIFKMENGRIVEHWDVRQDIPENVADADALF